MKAGRLPCLLLLLVLIIILSAPTAHTLETLYGTNTPPQSRAEENFAASEIVQAPLKPSGAIQTVQTLARVWHVECVECPRQFSDLTNRFLQIDNKGHPHLAYGGDHLYYTWYDGTQWHYETADPASWVGGYASLALDQVARPHISYLDWNNLNLKYAWRDATGWNIETIDDDSQVGWGTSLTLDSAGWPHISYVDYTQGHLKYAWYDGMDWRVETVDTEANFYVNTSLALDSSDHPHVSYYANQHLQHAWHDGANWHIETVDEHQQSYQCQISLALDSLDQPHISYGKSYYQDDTHHSDLVHAWHNGTSWQFETVDQAANYYSSLTIDGMNQPHISHHGNGYDLKYSWYDGTSWRTETLDRLYQTPVYPSLALDPSGHPHISYYYDDDIQYARYDGEAWHFETLDNSGLVGFGASLALDEANQPHISYGDWDKGNLKYASRDGEGWHTETVDEHFKGYRTSLALTCPDQGECQADGAGVPHISYGDDISHKDLKYATYTDSGWQIETVYTNTGRYNSLAVDEAGRPHISYYDYDYYDYGNHDLKYAWRDTTSWLVETVGQGSDGGSISLIVDKAGQPHISYPTSDIFLQYAWRDETGWHIERVDSRGQSPSLALDELGRPHISYQGRYETLKYAWHDGTNWHIETIDNEKSQWCCSSLALDKQGQPHIAYLARDPEGIKYAWRDGANWRIETVSSENGSISISLALDDLGQPHISYSGRGDLKYAFLSHLSLDKQATPSDNLRPNDTLTYTLTLSGPGLDVRLWDPLPPNVRYVANSVSGTLTPPPIYSPTVRAIIWQGTLPTDKALAIHFQVQSGAGTGSLSLQLPIVNTAWLTDTASKLSVSATIIVNSWRLYLPVLVRDD